MGRRDLHVDWKPPTHMKKAEPYHETRSRPWNSSVIFGMAVATMVLDRRGQHAIPVMASRGVVLLLMLLTMSRATRKMLRTRATMMKRSRAPSGYATSPSITAPSTVSELPSAPTSFSIFAIEGSSMVDGALVVLPLVERSAFSCSDTGAGVGTRVDRSLSKTSLLVEAITSECGL